MISVIPLSRIIFTGKSISGIIWVIQVQFQGQMRKYDFYQIQIASS